MRAYIWHNIRRTFDLSDRLEAMVSLVLITLSAAAAVGGSFVAPELFGGLETLTDQATVGIALFVVVQFGFLTPFRMWQDAVWVTNIESLLQNLWDFHDEGVKLFNSHHRPDDNFGGVLPIDMLMPEHRAGWLKTWMAIKELWDEQTSAQLEILHPLEARRFRNVVVTGPVISGIDTEHVHHLGMLFRKLELLKEAIDRHQPALLPE